MPTWAHRAGADIRRAAGPPKQSRVNWAQNRQRCKRQNCGGAQVGTPQPTESSHLAAFSSLSPKKPPDAVPGVELQGCDHDSAPRPQLSQSNAGTKCKPGTATGQQHGRLPQIAIHNCSTDSMDPKPSPPQKNAQATNLVESKGIDYSPKLELPELSVNCGDSRLFHHARHGCGSVRRQHSSKPARTECNGAWQGRCRGRPDASEAWLWMEKYG